MNCTWGGCDATSVVTWKHRPRLGNFAALCDVHSAEFDSMMSKADARQGMLALMKARGFNDGTIAAPVHKVGQSARVFVHTRCLAGPAAGALQVAFEERGYNADTIRIGPPSGKGHCEIMRFVSQDAETMTLDRFDGVRIVHRTVPEPLRAA